MEMFLLFVYGTLMDREVQCGLYGRVVSVGPAVLPGYGRFRDWDGYYYVDREPGAAVCGELLRLSVPELAMTDLWEEVPRYERRIEEICAGQGNPVPAQVYFAGSPRQRVPAQPGTLAAISRQEVMASVQRLRDEVAWGTHENG